MRYRLRTLLVVLAICPPILAVAWHDRTGALPAMLWLAVFTMAVPLAARALRSTAST